MYLTGFSNLTAKRGQDIILLKSPHSMNDNGGKAPHTSSAGISRALGPANIAVNTQPNTVALSSSFCQAGRALENISSLHATAAKPIGNKMNKPVMVAQSTSPLARYMAYVLISLARSNTLRIRLMTSPKIPRSASYLFIISLTQSFVLVNFLSNQFKRRLLCRLVNFSSHQFTRLLLRSLVQHPSVLTGSGLVVLAFIIMIDSANKSISMSQVYGSALLPGSGLVCRVPTSCSRYSVLLPASGLVCKVFTSGSRYSVLLPGSGLVCKVSTSGSMYAVLLAGSGLVCKVSTLCSMYSVLLAGSGLVCKVSTLCSMYSVLLAGSGLVCKVSTSGSMYFVLLTVSGLVCKVSTSSSMYSVLLAGSGLVCKMSTLGFRYSSISSYSSGGSGHNVPVPFAMFDPVCLSIIELLFSGRVNSTNAQFLVHCFLEALGTLLFPGSGHTVN
ncbi:unnamed protein product [Meganyctiphanes norvegica]|uniref:Uncharacterized protein n=1 Tax=Meganyctiphanes norvegica TaxID=48144 RepID=A0AAV2RE04_MEGNR